MNNPASQQPVSNHSPGLDIVSVPETRADTSRVSSSADRPFLGVRFNCCQVYARIYINSDRTHYTGACPRCAKPVCFRIGNGGTNQRFFDVY